MPTARKNQICLQATPYYHCTSRCVRRALLCGKGKNYDFEHRRQWIEDKLIQLQSVFAVDLCSYAIMSNHYHVVLHVDAELAKIWSMNEVFTRWHQLFKPKPLVQQYLTQPQKFSPAMLETIKEEAEKLRQRLMDISWFMRIVNEGIARIANKEDNCKGRFWEGRFTSQALLDEKSLIACMIYNDLNPVRANLAKTPENSDHTSIKQRIKYAQTNKEQPYFLMSFKNNSCFDNNKVIPFTLKDYIELVDWTGRIIRDDKRGAIPQYLPHIIVRLNIKSDAWLQATTQFEQRFKCLAGTIIKIKQQAKHFAYKQSPHCCHLPFA